MRKFLLSIFSLFATAVFALGQYAPEAAAGQDFTTSRNYKMAKSLFKGGLVFAGVSTAGWLAGNVICVIEQNKYTNSHSSSGTLEDIYALNQEARKQPGYKRGQIVALAGFAGMLAGGGIAWHGGSKMKKIKNAAGDTVAMIDYGISSSGLCLALTF